MRGPPSTAGLERIAPPESLLLRDEPAPRHATHTSSPPCACLAGSRHQALVWDAGRIDVRISLKTGELPPRRASSCLTLSRCSLARPLTPCLPLSLFLLTHSFEEDKTLECILAECWGAPDR